MDPSSEKLNSDGQSNETDTSISQKKSRAQTEFDEVYMYRRPPKKSLLRKFKKYQQDFSFKKTLLSLFPILNWIRMYSWKEDLFNDIVAGFTVAIMHVPQGMAYSMLGGVPPVVGIYMAFFPVLVYAIMGTSRHVSMGTFAVVCIMTGKTVSEYSTPSDLSITNSSAEIQDSFSNNSNYPQYTAIEVATGVCFMVGLWQLFFGFFKLGGLSVLLSETLVSGFSTGAAVHVLTSQVKHIFGLKIRNFNGPFKIIYTYKEIFEKINSVNYISMGVSAVAMFSLAVFNDWIRPYTRRRFRIPIPMELIVVIIGTLVSYFLDLNAAYNVRIVGKIPTGLPSPALPPFGLLQHIVAPGLVIAIVAFSITMSMASIFSRRQKYDIDGNQELLASGMSNVFASFFSCIPFAASLSRSLLQYDVGGKTQMASFVSCFLLLFVLLWIGPVFESLPNAVLASIVLVSLKGMFMQVKDVISIWRHSKMGGLIWMLTFLSVTFIDVDIGLGIGLGLSVLTVVMVGQKVKVFQFGNIPGTDVYLDISRYKAALKVQGILIVQIAGGIHFANIDYVRKKFNQILEKRCELDEEKISHVILDMACISFVDPVAAKNLISIFEELKEKNIELYFATCSVVIRESLERNDFFEVFPEEKMFPLIHDAVVVAQARNAL